MIVAALLASLAAQSAPLSASVANVTVIGLSEEQESGAKAKVDEELAALGATVFPGPVVEADCVPDPACLKNAMKDSGAEFWVYFEAIRVGPVVQISSTLYDSQAAEIAEGKGQADPDAFPQGEIIPGPVRAKLQELAAARAAATPAPDKTVEITAAPAKQPPKVGGGGMSMLQTTGLFVGGAGLVVAVVGGILAANEIATLEDPGSPGVDKERARVLGWFGVGAVALGLAAAGSGAGMFFLAE